MSGDDELISISAAADAIGPSLVMRSAAAVKGSGRLLQPAIKCRGRDYLRIIYGPDYDVPENIARLRKRGLGAKHSLALREHALGLEALDRFVCPRAATPRA